ncbi:MAG: low molecular weight phosphotyrosine protein phosphatase [Puniceicoccales bacterium]|nr:low molecular weight phosphotyrosine protein phosphatase [Puniceicoccales bacterium]
MSATTEDAPPPPAPRRPAASPPPPRNTILFVCTGNICRSPMAEGLLRAALRNEQPPLRDLKVASCGTFGEVGCAATGNAVRAMSSVSIDISHHRARAAERDTIRRAAVIFCMTREHLGTLRRMFGDELPAETHLMRGFIPENGGAGGDEVSDPWGGSLTEYSDCRDCMVEAMPSLLAFLREKFNAAGTGNAKGGAAK